MIEEAFPIHGALEVQDFSVKLQPGYQLVCHIYSVGHVTSRKGEMPCVVRALYM